MRSLAGLALGFLVTVAPMAGAQGGDAPSLRPVARPVADGGQVGPVAADRVSTSSAVRPLARPAPAAMAAAARAPHEGDAAMAMGLLPDAERPVVVAHMMRSLHPVPRPPSIVERAMAQQREAQKGRAGGIRGVQGDVVGKVEGRGACVIDNAVRVTAVSGVRLSTPALLDVPTTRALKSWVDTGLLPAIGQMGGGVSLMHVVAHYACRTRNNQPGGRLSEHSFGRAIDIAAFTLRNGDRIVLTNDWGQGRKGRALRKMHGAACGPFGTVLGPEANRFHRDHFHFDTARHRSGSYCR